MYRFLAGILVAIALLPGIAFADAVRVGAKISSQTTTTLVALIAGQRIFVNAASFCVDANGATTGLTIRDSAGTNLIGTSVVYVVGPGQCLVLPVRPDRDFYANPTAAGTSLQVVTTVGNGPVEVSVEALQR